ncbi:MAG: Rv3235 family protein [Pseudonocardia sp.]|nr:Rv3235 family protein [Pseudonocardia sp.]MDN5920468.1 Rv3235 family protein [Pseudonocardia sp.]
MAPTTNDAPQAGSGGPILRHVVYEPAVEHAPVAAPAPAPVELGAVAAPRPVGVVPAEWVVDEATRQRITRLVVVLLEVLDGRRAPVAALGAAPVLRYLAVYSRRRALSASRALSVRIYQPRPFSAEVAAVCVIDGAYRAVALRVERDEHPFDGYAWRATALRVL